MFDARALRKDFPILARQVHGKPLVYLDNAATTQKPVQVLEALSRLYREHNANVHRGAYRLSEETTQLYEGSRDRVAKFIGAPSSRSVIFTRNATEAVNLVAYSWGRKNLEAGDEVIISDLEHHSNLVPWVRLTQEKGAVLKIWRSNAEGVLPMQDFKDLLSVRTRLVAVTQMSNVLGTMPPLKDVMKAAQAYRALVLVDGAQGAPHLPVDVNDLGCDFYACSAHKMLGPTGIGVLYGKEEVLRAMDPFLGGGEMIREVSFERVTWNDLPWKFEAGTPNFADAVAFGAALEYLEGLGMKAVREHERNLTAYAHRQLASLGDWLTLYGPRDADLKGGVIPFNIEGIHAHDVGTAMDLEGVAVRAGHHCAQPLMKKLGVPATARASFYIYNTEEDVDVFVAALKRVHQFFHAPVTR